MNTTHMSGFSATRTLLTLKSSKQGNSVHRQLCYQSNMDKMGILNILDSHWQQLYADMSWWQEDMHVSESVTGLVLALCFCLTTWQKHGPSFLSLIEQERVTVASLKTVWCIHMEDRTIISTLTDSILKDGMKVLKVPRGSHLQYQVWRTWIDLLFSQWDLAQS